MYSKKDVKNAQPAPVLPVLSADEEKRQLEILACKKEVDEIMKKYNCQFRVIPHYVIEVLKKEN
ncbi:MAG: hypothetical protein ACOZAL_01055 [Patescibacteria group bacterium]